MKGRSWRLALAIAFFVGGCRYRYEELALGAGVPGTGASAGVSVQGGTAGKSTSEGGEPTTGGASDGPSQESGAGGATTLAGTGNEAGAAGASDVVGTGGAGDVGVPPDSALCVQGTYAGHDYLFCAEERSWSDANAGCIAIGMRLVRIDDATENQWVFDNVNVPGGTPPDVWIGATDTALEAEWRWTDGDQFWLGTNTGTAQGGLFEAWNANEPNSVAGDEDCAAMLHKAPEWLDARCFTLWPYVCESL